MSRPRKPFGANHPGRLPATMMKVLAAEMSDPRRLRRGKQYAKDGSVLDIVVEPGAVTCEVQGSRSTPYIATIEVTRGDGMPLRRDISKHCTCPDDDNWDDYACKHVVASMFTFSDELLLEPELLDVWRDRARAVTPSDDGDGDEGADGERGRRPERHLRIVPPPGGAAKPAPTRERRDAAVDPLRDVLAVPAGAHLPEIGEIEESEVPMPKRRELAAVLRDALANLRIDWE